MRLGFSRETMADWLEKAGLGVEQVVDLKPETDMDRQLTVTIWLARDRRQAAVPDVSAGARALARAGRA
jgi:ArsR family transcriptional regulator